MESRAVVKEKHPRNDQLCSLLDFLATHLAPLYHFAQVWVISEGKLTPRPGCRCLRFKPNGSRMKVDLLPAQHENFHSPPAS
jgi:hypothetical protein